MSTVDEVQQAVMERMLRGDLQPGTWLRQDDLAAQLGVSKIPVREALHRLAASDLLRFENNRGVVVPLLTAEDAAETFGLRLAIEPELLRRAVGGGGGGDGGGGSGGDGGGDGGGAVRHITRPIGLSRRRRGRAIIE